MVGEITFYSSPFVSIPQGLSKAGKLPNEGMYGCMYVSMYMYSEGISVGKYVLPPSKWVYSVYSE